MIAMTFSLLESFISVFIASKVTDILAIGRKRKLQGWKGRGGVLMKRFSGIYLLRDTLVQLLAAFSFSNSIRRFWAGLEFYCICHHQIIQALRLFRSNSSAPRSSESSQVKKDCYVILSLLLIVVIIEPRFSSPCRKYGTGFMPRILIYLGNDTDVLSVSQQRWEALRHGLNIARDSRASVQYINSLEHSFPIQWSVSSVG